MRKLLATAFAAALVSTATRAAADQSPLVTHTPVTSAAAGGFVKVMARVTDAVKVFPQVFFRYHSSAQAPYEKALDMKPVKGEPHLYGANIPTRGAGLDYYVEAYDELGNGPGRAGSPEAPFHVAVGAGQPRANATTPPAASAAPPASAAPSGPPESGTPNAAPPGTASAPPSSGSTSPGGRAPASSSSARRAPSGATSRGQGEAPSRTWTWAVGGTGLGLLAGGLLAGTAARTADNAYNDRLKDPQNNPVTLRSQYDAAHGLRTQATILTIAGAVLVAGGVALYFLEPGLNGTDQQGGVAFASEPAVSVAAAPVEGGGAVAMAGRF